MSDFPLNESLFPDGFGAETPEAASWRCFFEEKTDLVERVRRLPRPEAERAAFDIILVEFLKRTHPDTAAPCAANPRRRTRPCCRSASAFATRGCTETAGRHGASSAEPRLKTISPAWAL
jgi:hypothetical protein